MNSNPRPLSNLACDYNINTNKAITILYYMVISCILC